MSRDIPIGFVAPPFAGHLFPLLELARGLRTHGYHNLRFYSTPEAERAVSASGFTLSPLLEGVSHVVLEISDTERQVGSNPFQLLHQLRMNLSLMDQLRDELRALWGKDQPMVIIADLTVPAAGLLAQQMGIHWWSSLPTICVIETKDGTPSYLGGWMPPSSLWGRMRDFGGRTVIRCFKKTIRLMFRRQLQRLGIDRIYRSDGSETVYSNEKILGLGVEAFEFPRQWPATLEFIGPLTASPDFPHDPPEFEEGRTHVLVSLGTHLWWAKDTALALLEDVASRMPETMFHYTVGNADVAELAGFTTHTNLRCHRYMPYQDYLHRYDAVIHHGGAGVMYACLQRGIPALVWPQDYDQFDHAARMVYHGLGIRMRPKAAAVVHDLRRLLADPGVAQRLKVFQAQVNGVDPIARVRELLDALE